MVDTKSKIEKPERPRALQDGGGDATVEAQPVKRYEPPRTTSPARVVVQSVTAPISQPATPAQTVTAKPLKETAEAVTNSATEEHRPGWPVWALADAVKELGADTAKAYQQGRKIYIPTKEAGVFIVFDPAGDYFRVYRFTGKDTTKKRRSVLNYYTRDGLVRDLIEKRQAEDPEFAKMYATDEDFKRRAQDDYQQVTHFNNRRA